MPMKQQALTRYLSSWDRRFPPVTAIDFCLRRDRPAHSRNYRFFSLSRRTCLALVLSGDVSDRGTRKHWRSNDRQLILKKFSAKRTRLLVWEHYFFCQLNIHFSNNLSIGHGKKQSEDVTNSCDWILGERYSGAEDKEAELVVEVCN